MYKEVIERYGKSAQLEKCKEELLELIDAINTRDDEGIKEELADVLNMLIQLFLIKGFDVLEVYEIMRTKMIRTLGGGHSIS